MPAPCRMPALGSIPAVTNKQNKRTSLYTRQQEPVPHIQAHPLPNNLLEWHFVLEGAKGTDFEGGLFHGKLVFPPNYPFKPPSISIFTPNGGLRCLVAW